MPTLKELKESSPAYQALTDEEFADRVYKKHYADRISREEFDRRTAPVDVGTDIVSGASRGFNTGFDATLNALGAPIRAPVNYVANQLGYEGELIPELQAARRFNVTEKPQTTGGRAAEAVGKVVGGSVLPSAGLSAWGQRAGTAAKGLLGQYARNPAKETGLDLLSGVGAGSGVAYARENELGPTGEIALGLVGGAALPNAVNIPARTYAGVRSGTQYANRQIQRARDPRSAAYQDVADQMVKAGADPGDIRTEVAPQPSSALRNRNFTQDDMADIVSRSLAGESADDIAQAYRLHPDTVRRYVRNYQEANPTPRNVIDVSKEQIGSGRATPLSNQARADMAISDDAEAAQRLISRQREQPGRTANIIEQSGVDGRNFEDEIERLATSARQEETAAYNLARQNAGPVNIRSVIRAARAKHPQEGGQISEQMNRAIDLFFRGEMRDTAKGLRYRRVSDIVDDVPTYLRRRYELDQMIENSKNQGRSTPLTAQLTEFRRRLNDAARRNNRDLRRADERFSENRTIERILDRGGEIAKRLSPRTRRALREFNSLSPTQQELTRVAFERQLLDDVMNKRTGHAVADQFNTDAFRSIVERLYPRPRAQRGPQRTAEREIYQRGQDLLRNLRRESISTETTRDVLSGSRTAPLQDDMAELMEGPRAAADLATGRFGQVLENLSNRLARQIGRRAAQERIRILTETDPAEMLPMLSRLAREAQTSAQRQAYIAAIRELGATGRTVGPATGVGLTTAAGQEQ